MRADDLEVVDCPICETGDPRPWAVEYRGYRIVRCEGCGLRFVSPRRSEAADRAFYDADYFSRQTGREEDPETRRYVDMTDRRYIETIFRYCRIERPRILDVGVGRGSFAIRVGRMAGVRSVAGTDVTDANADHLRDHGVELHVGDVVDLDLSPCDVVTAHHVLEHVRDPNAFLSKVRSLLTDGGIFHVVVPNEGSLVSRYKSFLSRHRLKRHPFKHLSPDHHLFFYDRRTLEALVAKNGFEVLFAGTMASAKPRSVANRLAHHALDVVGLNAWFEYVLAPIGR